jgi:hypothetical protein
VPSADEVTIRLKSPADLFRTVDTDMFLEHGRLVSGIDEVLQELTPRRWGPADALSSSCRPNRCGERRASI